MQCAPNLAANDTLINNIRADSRELLALGGTRGRDAMLDCPAPIYANLYTLNLIEH